MGKLINQLQGNRKDPPGQRERQEERWGRDRDRGGGWRRESGPADRSRDKGQAPPDERAGGEVTKP